MAATLRPGLHRLLPLAQSFTFTSNLLQLRKKVSPATTAASSSSFIFCLSYSTFFRSRFLRAHGLPSCSASTPCPLTSIPQTGILVLQCLRNSRAIRTLYLQPNPNNQIYRKSNRSQSKTSPMNRPTTTYPQSVFNQLPSSPLRTFLHLPKHPQFRHRLLPSIRPHTKHARHAPPLEQPTNHHLHPLPPPPTVKTGPSDDQCSYPAPLTSGPSLHYYCPTTSSCSLSPPSTASHDPSASSTHTPSHPGPDPETTSQWPHHALPLFGQHPPIFWTPTWTAPLPLRQHHHVQHLLQLTQHTAFHHHRNPLHLPYFRHSHHYQNFHSQINRPPNLPPPSCGLRAARLLQRLPTC